tara:strand:+ start:9784 stop:10926 length:1143 start_codon:yes stop_codon:yes gene_type:complete
MIKPHGNKLINLYSNRDSNSELDKPILSLTNRSISDLLLIANGAFSPITGFMNQEDYLSVLKNMRLSNNLVWSLPIVLPVSDDQLNRIKNHNEVLLSNKDGNIIGKIFISDIFKPNKTEEALSVYLTDDLNHPGVNVLKNSGDWYIAGEVEAYKVNQIQNFTNYIYEPIDLREQFVKKEWQTIVGFQTRNPIHRAHEYLLKCALEQVDGLLINPIVGDTKKDDIPSEIRMECYESMIKNYFPQKHAMLAVYPAFMRYAGPREAIFHALTRQNYGCTHFIVGRDHAGVGNYYGTYDAQKIFENFDFNDIQIKLLFFEHSFYCKRTKGMATSKTSIAKNEEKIFLSGTKVREMLLNGENLPIEFTRPEINKILLRYYKNETK